jgi:uncharacterized protein (DUF849 family)
LYNRSSASWAAKAPGRGKLAESNAEQVQLIRHILEALSLEIASPEEARQILKLKGADHVNF